MNNNIYEIVETIFQNATDYITRGLYNGAQYVFNNGFFNVAFSLSVIWLGSLIAFNKLKSEEIAHKFIWTILLFAFVKTIIYNQYMYESLVTILNTPRDVFIDLIHNFVSDIDKNASVKNIITNLASSISSVGTYIFNQVGLNNISAVFYGLIVYASGAFLIIVIFLNSVFSIFLSNVVLALLPFVLPFLIWKKSEGMFFSWVKLYISISLYAPFTLLFGLIAVETTRFTMFVSHNIQTDFKSNVMYIFALVIVQALTALAIFKIPNIINQIIGSSNEGSSLTGGIGTISAGGAIVSTLAKASGMKFAGAQSVRGATSVAKKGGKLARTIADKVSIR